MIKRLIDANALIEVVKTARKRTKTLTGMDVVMTIERQPTIEAIPLEFFEKWKIEPMLQQGINNILYMWKKEQEAKT